MKRPLVAITDPHGRRWLLTQNEARGLSRATVLNGHAVTELNTFEEAVNE